MPYAKYPVAEEFLGAADMLVTDWSSIAFDMLAAKRPVIYLDVAPPFEKGFTLDGSYRFGPVVGSLAELFEAAKKYTGKTAAYRRDFKDVIERSENVAYGGLADGKANQRYLERLQAVVKRKQNRDV
jgi:CDP-glycerol glycerophosphotransferase